MRNSDDAGHILQENIVPATLVRNSQIIENVVRGDDGRVPGARDSHIWGSSAAGAGGQILDNNQTVFVNKGFLAIVWQIDTNSLVSQLHFCRRIQVKEANE